MKTRRALTTPLVLVVVLLLGAVPAQAGPISYYLAFSGVWDGFGSGTATFDDTPVGPGRDPGSTRYDFTSFVGTGEYGDWESSYSEYNSATGENKWVFYADISAGGSDPPHITGLTPVMALEYGFAYQASEGHLTWSRVPDPGSTLLLLGIAFSGLRVSRKLWR